MAGLGPRADEQVDVVGLEVVRVLHEARQVGHPVIGHAASEDVCTGQRGQHSPPTRACSTDQQTPWIRFATLCQASCDRDHILHVDDAPLAAQPVAILAAVTGRAAIVDTHHADPAAGEVGDLQVERW